MAERTQGSGSSDSNTKARTKSKAKQPKLASKSSTPPRRKTPAKIARPRSPTDDERTRLIAETAYLRAERRGFMGGDPVVDWLEAEEEVDSALAS